MPAGRAAKRGAPAVRPPSARRAALTRPTEPDLPAPPVRRRRIASAAAGRPDDLPPTDAASTASMVAIVTREVLKQLREDRDKLKGKIWANEFIDFLDLTHPVQQQPHQISVQSGESHQLVSIMPQTRVR